jgi:hypothetical protein
MYQKDKLSAPLTHLRHQVKNSNVITIRYSDYQKFFPSILLSPCGGATVYFVKLQDPEDCGDEHHTPCSTLYRPGQPVLDGGPTGDCSLVIGFWLPVHFYLAEVLRNPYFLCKMNQSRTMV